MSSFSLWCLNYLLNALWQLPLILFAAILLLKAGRQAGPDFQHRVWVGTLLFQIFLPSIAGPPALSLFPAIRPLLGLLANRALGSRATVEVSFGDSFANALSLPAGPWRWFLVSLAAATAALLTVRLLWHLWCLGRLSRSSNTHLIPNELAGRWAERCRLANVPRAKLALSDQVHGPVTFGIMRPIVLLPVHFFACTSGEDQNAALAHECAHIQRHDFTKNLVYEILSLPLAFHPVRYLTLARIASSREIVCDAHAATALDGSQRYALSLLRLAATVLSAASVANPHAIGLCDAHTLERRIMTLIKGQQKLGTARRFGIAAATLALAGATCTTALALRMHMAPPTQNATAGNAVEVSGDIMAGSVLARVNPTYPLQARQAHITGTIVLKAVIGKDGAIEDLSVVSGPVELQNSAIDAVRQWVYKPYLLNGVPTEVQTTIHVNYQLAE